MDQRWGPHTIDRLATCLEAHVPRSNSRTHNPGSDGVNALEQPWGGENNWAHPPVSLAGEVINLIITQRATATVILPVWQAQEWLAVATTQAQEAYLLPRVDDLGRSSLTETSAPHPTWRVAAFRFLNGGQPIPRTHPLSALATGGRAQPPSSGGETSAVLWQVPHLAASLTPLPSSSRVLAA